jgi:DNA-binding IscR family transcriptional regulator
VLLRGHAPEGAETPLGRELLAARAMLEVALAYARRRAPPDPGEVALTLETHGEPVREIFGVLRARGLVLEAAGGGFVPARPLDQITLADVRQAVSGQPPVLEGNSAEAFVSRILAAAEGAAGEELATRSYADLCAHLSPAPDVAPQESPAHPA